LTIKYTLRSEMFRKRLKRQKEQVEIMEEAPG
jgi:hypothetical protein